MKIETTDTGLRLASAERHAPNHGSIFLVAIMAGWACFSVMLAIHAWSASLGQALMYLFMGFCGGGLAFIGLLETEAIVEIDMSKPEIRIERWSMIRSEVNHKPIVDIAALVMRSTGTDDTGKPTYKAVLMLSDGGEVQLGSEFFGLERFDLAVTAFNDAIRQLKSTATNIAACDVAPAGMPHLI